MTRLLVYVLVLTLSLCALISAQPTGYTDTFDGEMHVSGPPSFSFQQEDGLLWIKIDKESKVWQGVYYDIGQTIDITSFPYLNLTFKSTIPFLLTAYIVDADNNNMTQNVQIFQSDTHVTYTIDFSAYAANGVDASRVTGLIFTPNGNTHDGLVGDVFMENLRLGTDAEKQAGIGAVPTPHFFIGSNDNEVRLLNLTHASDIQIHGAETSLENINVTSIQNRHASISFDCSDGVAGIDTLFVIVVGDGDYHNNEISIPFEIESNKPPRMESIDKQEIMVGDTLFILLSGIDDGNAAVEQPIQITAKSNKQQALPDSNIKIEYVTSATTARLTYSAVQPAADLLVTIQLDDLYPVDNLFETSFSIHAYQDYNYPPTVNKVPNQFTYLAHGKMTIQLSGISDGGNNTQNLTFSTKSSNESVVPASNISISHTYGESIAELYYTPTNVGFTTVSVILKDDGGTESNNGDGTTEIRFQIEVGNLPPTGHTVPMGAFVPDTAAVNVGDWKIEGLGEAQIPALGSFYGKENVVKIDLNDKSCWTGIWYHCPELNIDEHRYLSYEIYFEGGTFAEAGAGQTHCYYWDSDMRRNLPAAHAERKTIKVNEWQTVFCDFRASDGMQDDDGVDINTKRIQQILINYATAFSWPFPVDNGTVYIANIQLGSAVPKELVPTKTPQCTIDPVPNMILFPNQGEKSFDLTGITAGPGNETQATVSAKSSSTNFIPDPVVSAVDDEGKATLTFTPKEGTGSSTITLTVSADGSRDKIITFKIYVIKEDISDAVTVEVVRDSLYQTIRGFGTYQFPGQQNYIDYYTTDLGASAVRIGIISNQIEPVNDNNDPHVLDLAAFNYDAFDFNYYRLLKEKGVRTFILTSWSPPAWMKRNLSASYGYASAPHYEDTDNILEPHYYEEFAESMVAAVRLFQNEAGITLDALGPQNEPAFTEPYPSAVLSPRAYADLTALIGERFKKEGISTQLYMPEQVFSQNHYSMAEYINALRTNPLTDEHTAIIATHGYDTDGVGEAQPTYSGWTALWNQSQKCQFPKELWMTETFPQYSNWDSALSLAGAIHGALVYGNVGLWTLWSIEGTLMDKGRPTESFYTSKNYYKYIRPGARRAKAIADHKDILVSSFIHTGNRSLTIVLLNKGDVPLTVNVSGDSIPARYDCYLTAKHINFEYQGPIYALHTVAIPAKSVITLVGNIDGPIAAVEEEDFYPDRFELRQNYPNPFNPATTIQFHLPMPAKVTIDVYNVLGQHVKLLDDQMRPAGKHTIIWDGTSDTGLPVSTGMYFYRMKAGDFLDVKKCLLVR